MSTTGGALARAQGPGRRVRPGATAEAAGTPPPDTETDITFEDLFRRSYGSLVHLATLLVGSRADGEAVVHEAFARVALRWARIDRPEAHLRRCVVERSRAVRRRRRLPGARPEAPGPRPGPEDDPLAAHVASALAGMPERMRTAVVLRYGAGLSEDEAAAAQGVRRRTATARLRRALAHLERDLRG